MTCMMHCSPMQDTMGYPSQLVLRSIVGLREIDPWMVQKEIECMAGMFLR